MTIDRTKLVKLLIEKTSLSPGEVKKQLEQLIERILDAADRGKALEIKEFGLFFFDQEGDLKFEPSQELSTEISFKYAGMKPVELKPERNTAIPADDDPSGPINATDDVISVPKSDPKSPPAIPKASSKPKTATKPVSTYPKRGKKDRSAVWALLSFLAVLFVGALIYFNRPMDPVYEDSVAVSGQTQQGSESSGSPDFTPDNDQDFESNEASVEMSDGNGNNQVPAEEQITESSVPIQEQMYGLSGEIAENTNSWYSIVIHSFYNELRANAVAENFRTDGYRTQVTERVVGGIEVWRVSLGQFESIPDAQEAAETLPEPFNENNFIQRIQQQ